MLFSLVAKQERNGKIIDTKELTVEVLPGQSFPIGFGSIVVCHDGIILSYHGKQINVETAPGKVEPLVRLNNEEFFGKRFQNFHRGETLEIITPTTQKFLIERQTIEYAS